MTHRLRMQLSMLAMALCLPAMASAQTAYTTRDVNIRAGPARDYPLVAWVPSGTPLTVAGCYEGWRWCDVIAPPARGWVYAGFLSYPYQGGSVTIASAGPVLGIALVPFSIGVYWDNYYRGRPWYPKRSYWMHRPPPHYRPPTGPPRPPVVRPPRPPRPSPPTIQPVPNPPSTGRPRPPSRPSPPTIQPVPSRPGTAPPSGRPTRPSPPTIQPAPSRPTPQRPGTAQ
ncbi:MAG TPA: SH3 domain-containing protein [Casimicrobiaceae bacterium]|nr:SH3 domain-containing protein [Casimicrobiaceae bacterium]